MWLNIKKYFSTGLFIFLALPASTNYKLQGYEFGGGGVGNATSTNYALNGVTGSLSAGTSSSTSYKGWFGLNFLQMANVPGTPTVTNPSSYYNKLKIVLDTQSNPTDTTYAIAISPDGFASTTSYVQSDNSIGSTLGTEDYQTYSSWGGASGFLVIGLQASTTYTVKVKAMQGKFSETQYGPTASASTVAPSITFSIGAVSSGTTLEGVTTDVTTTSTSVPFATLSRSSRVEAANSLTVSTNAVSGYTVTVKQIAALQNGTGKTFPQVSGTNASPSAWPSSVVDGAYGYHPSDDALGTGTTGRFASNNTFAQFTTSPLEAVYTNAPATNEVSYNIYAIELGKGQEPGDYAHTVSYAAYGTF